MIVLVLGAGALTTTVASFAVVPFRVSVIPARPFETMLDALVIGWPLTVHAASIAVSVSVMPRSRRAL